MVSDKQNYVRLSNNDWVKLCDIPKSNKEQQITSITTLVPQYLKVKDAEHD